MKYSEKKMCSFGVFTSFMEQINIRYAQNLKNKHNFQTNMIFASFKT